MTFVRIKPPKNINDKGPQSISSGGARIVRGGAGIEVKDANTVKRLRKVGGGLVETSKTPFDAVAPKGGIIDLDAMKMKTPEKEPAKDEKEPVEDEKKS